MCLNAFILTDMWTFRELSASFTLSRKSAAALLLYFSCRVQLGLKSSWSSRNSLNFPFPPAFIFSSSISFHLSMVTERTKLQAVEKRQ